MRNRYAWTSAGPVVIENGGYYKTRYVRGFLAKQGILITRWARNWSAFLGYATCNVSLPNPYAYPQEVQP